MFDNIDKLVVGDCFYISVLDELLEYKVSSINIVLPDETESLTIKEGEDLVTLVTCTPKHVNTHRLLVTGSRVMNDNSKQNIDKQVNEEKKVEFLNTLKSDSNTLFIYGIIIFIIIIIICIIKIKKLQIYIEKRKILKYNKKEITKEKV